MASLIPEFEYDIFISYRQKDNKYDGWVTDFVSHLKSELEATFKDEVSVYFDENQHDGLLETHNVDKSLEGKLKCLVFIPIISQTYCDPKSFAWKQEFLAFNNLARSDRFGLDIKLFNGNVGSRILPVRIHEIGPEDKSMFEKETGNALRCVDFIYKSPGVNRPLRSSEDNPSSNQNKTFYRDQINKVANSIKDIVDGMNGRTTNEGRVVARREVTTSGSHKKSKVALYLFLVALLTAGTYYFFSTYGVARGKKDMRNGSIAILPFENQTGKPELNSVGQVAADFISTQLIQHKFFKVIPAQDIFRETVYSGVVTNPAAEKIIADQGRADYIVIGHYNVIADSILLVVSVNDVAEKSVLYTTPVIKSSVTDPMNAVNNAQQLILGYLLFSSSEKSATGHPPNYNAYLEYMKGMEFWAKYQVGPGNITGEGIPIMETHFKSSISQDENFLPPYFKLLELYGLSRRFAKQDSVLQVLGTKERLFNEMEGLNYEIQRLTIARNWEALEQLLLSKTELSSGEFRPYFLLGSLALVKQNKPRKALEYLNQCDLSQFDFVNKPSDQQYYTLKAEAHFRLGELDEIIDLTNNLTLKPFGPLLIERWLAMYYTKKTDQLSNEVNVYLRQAKANEYIMMGLFRAAQRKGDTTSMKDFYHTYQQFVKQWDDQPLAHAQVEFVYAVMMYRVRDNVAEAERMLSSSDLPIVNRQRRIHQLALLYASTGREAKAREVLADLLAHENKYDFGLTRYYCAKVEAQLGNKDKAVAYLKESIDKGKEYGVDEFEYDADLSSLLDYPPFIELVRPKD